MFKKPRREWKGEEEKPKRPMARVKSRTRVEGKSEGKKSKRKCERARGRTASQQNPRE
jgi:hypothetical protein